MATVAEDLTKGIGIDDAVRGGVTVALGREAYEWADEIVKARSSSGPAGRRPALQQRTSSGSGPRSQASQQAKTLIRQWLSGALAVTAMQLARMILAILGAPAGRPGGAVAEAWHMGRQPRTPSWRRMRRTGTAGSPAPRSRHDLDGLEEWIASHGRDSPQGIEDTAADELAAYLASTAHSGADPDVIAAGSRTCWARMTARA